MAKNPNIGNLQRGAVRLEAYVPYRGKRRGSGVPPFLTAAALALAAVAELLAKAR